MFKKEKKKLVENLVTTLTGAKTLLFVNYTGLSVGKQQELKRRLAESGSTMVVVKNTLLKKAAESANLPAELITDEALVGQTALVMAGSDSVSPIQVLGKFAKEFEVTKMKVGIVDGTFQGAEALLAISKLPGKDILFGKVLGAISAPLYGLVGTLNGNTQKLLYILKTKAG